LLQRQNCARAVPHQRTHPEHIGDSPGRTWLAAHKARAEELVWFFYVLAALSAIALILPIKWPGSSVSLAIAVLVLGAIALGAGGYIAYAGGRIRHSEFRNKPSLQQSSATAARETAPAAKPAASVAPAAARVTIAALEYSPERIQIRKGDTVEWDNNDLTPHTVTSENGSELDSGSIEADASWSHTFTQTGEFPYFCTFHPEMKGTIVVN